MAGSTDVAQDLDLRRPFARADAIQAGPEPKLLRGSRFRRLFRGVYILREVPVSPFVRTQATLVLHPPSAFASHVSAARVYRLPVPDLPSEDVSVRDPAHRRTRPGITLAVA